MEWSTEPLTTLVERWLEWDKDPQTRKEIEQLRDASDNDVLEKRLRDRIQFGTAGLRGRMQAGFSSMNGLTVIQASQGLAKFIVESHDGTEKPSVVIGRDARHNSQKFALLAANAFRALGIHVWWFDQVVPTPFVPFTVLLKKASAGVMITASHNPAKDNGYKVYFKNGAQINSPIDAQIADSIKRNLEPWPASWDGFGTPHERRTELHEEVTELYCSAVSSFANSTTETWKQPSQFVYTPLHGVGNATMANLCDTLGITTITTVQEQKDPDPDFPTVRFPNPEEAGALDLAMKTADNSDIGIVIANDPDADRFAAAEKREFDCFPAAENRKRHWFRLTGDQLGVLLASYILESRDKNAKSDKPLAMLSSAVSTGMLSKMAEKNGFHFEETLTGFKWMGNIARKLESEGYEVPFAFEEALGYMFTKVCYDKDGLTASMVFLAAQAKWREQGLTPFEKLQELYKTYGYHENLNTYFVSPDTKTTATLFEGIRGRVENKQNNIGSFPILRWRDMTKGYDSGTPDNVPALPVDPSSQMVTVWSNKGIRFTLRGSGTEPKVKIYIESCNASRGEAITAVSDMLYAVFNDWIRPFAPAMTCASSLTTSSNFCIERPQ